MSDKLKVKSAAAEVPAEVPAEVLVEASIAPVEVVAPAETHAKPPVEAPVAPVAPVIPHEVAKKHDSECLPVDVSFDELQIAAIVEAGLEPGQVRQEIGLAKVGKTPVVAPEDKTITLTEAIERAKAKLV